MISSLENRRIRFDILRIPLLGHFLKWKHSRTAMQIVLFAAAAVIIVDGIFGTQLAAKNVATVGAWVHYRGIVVFALLLVGNLFCAACPFMLPRKLAKWIGKPTRRWPQALRNKWLALVGLIGIIYTYELFDLWASPWWTAWLAVAYFATAFVLEAFFTRSSFCMYVCPLGSFNFLYSTVSPTQITSRDLQTCRDCVGKECINGSETQNGCDLELFVPTIQSNMNCTLCLDCVKACPHDNVALTVRPPGDELFRQNWPHRLDLAYLAIMASSVGFINAFGMTPPVYRLELYLGDLLNTQSEAIVLGLIYLVSVILAPILLAYAAAWIGRELSRQDISLNRLIMRHAYSFVPLGFAIWIAHYLFHFAIGAMTIVPAFQDFFARTLNWPLLGTSNWQMPARYVPAINSVQIWQTIIMYIGLFTAIGLTIFASRNANKGKPGGRNAAAFEALPWIIVLCIIAVASGITFLLPMEMRGSPLGG